MTESTHPSDEQLSAAIDGLDDAAAAHAQGCGRCSYRLSAMRSVAEAIGTPPPVGDALLRGRVIAAAMQHDVDAPGLADNAKRLASAPWLIGIAAALVAALLLVPVLTRSDGGDKGDSLAGPAPSDAEVGDGNDGANNLGSFRDARELGSVVAALIGDETTADGGGGQPEGQGPPEVAPMMGAPPPGGPADNEAAAFAGDAKCASNVAREYGQTEGSLVYSGVLVWEDKPAVLLAYRVENAQGPLDHRLFVLSSADCTLFTALSI